MRGGRKIGARGIPELPRMSGVGAGGGAGAATKVVDDDCSGGDADGAGGGASGPERSISALITWQSVSTCGRFVALCARFLELCYLVEPFRLAEMGVSAEVTV